MSGLNLAPPTVDPFSDAAEEGQSVQQEVIHIRIQQRNGRKTLTTIQGIAEEYDKKKLLRYFKSQFSTNGTVINHPEYGEVIQLQGDQRNDICNFLVDIKLAKKEQLKVHGF